jgi:hypothetical protein
MNTAENGWIAGFQDVDQLPIISLETFGGGGWKAWNAANIFPKK